MQIYMIITLRCFNEVALYLQIASALLESAEQNNKRKRQKANVY